MRFISALCLFLLVGCGSMTEQDLVVKTYNDTVRFVHHGGSALGSGSIVNTGNGTKVILTNAHVCDAYSYRGFEVQALISGVLYQGLTVIFSNSKYDLCAVYLPHSLMSNHEGIDLGETPTLGQKFLMSGYPRDESMKPVFGYIAERMPIQIVIEMPPTGNCIEGIPLPSFIEKGCIVAYDLVVTSVVSYPGNSGSAAVDMSGRLIGVLNSGSNNTHYGNIIAVDLVKPLLKDL